MTRSTSFLRHSLPLLFLVLLLGAFHSLQAATYTWQTGGTGYWDASSSETSRWGTAQNTLWDTAIHGGTNTAVFTTSGATTTTGTAVGIVYLNQLTGVTDNGSGKNIITGGTLSFAGTNPKIFSSSTAGGGLQIDSGVQSSGNLRVDLWQGAVRLNADNSSTLSGTITLTGSTGGSYQNLISLDVGHNKALGTATVVVEPNFSSASPNTTMSYVKLGVASVTVGNNFVLSGTGGSNGYGQIYLAANSTTTGTVSLNGNALISIGGNSTGNMLGVVADGVTPGKSLTIASVGNLITNVGTLNLGGTNTFTGDLNVGAAITIKLSSGKALQNQNTVNFITAARRSTGSAVLQLNGNSTTVGLISSTHGLYSALVENASSSTAATLTVGNSNALSGTFIGSFRDGGTKALTLAKAGSGTLVLAGTSGHTGGTQINGGTLKLDYGVAATGTQTTLDGFLPTGGNVTIADGATLSVTGRVNGTAASLSSGAYDFRDQDVYLNSTLNLIKVASTSGLAPGMLVSGNGIAAGTYITTIISGSQFRVSAVGTTGSYTGETLTVTPADYTTAQTIAGLALSSGTGTLEVVNKGLGTTLTVTGTVSGNGALRKTGDGVLVLQGTNSYSGVTAIDAGTLKVDDGSIASSSGIINNGTLVYNLNANNQSYGNAISGTGSLVKSGSNMLTLSGTNSYSGSTTIIGGKLVVSGLLSGTTSLSVGANTELVVNGLINGASTTSVSGTLGGSGSLGAVSVGNGATVSPGNGSGTLTFTSASFAHGSTIKLELNKSGTQGGSAGSNWDQLTVTNNLDLSAVNADGITLQLAQYPTEGWSWNPDVDHTWSAFLTFGGATNFDINKFFIDSRSFTGSGKWSVVKASESQLDLQYLAVPEPNCIAMLLGGFGMLLFAQRMRGRSNP